MESRQQIRNKHRCAWRGCQSLVRGPYIFCMGHAEKFHGLALDGFKTGVVCMIPNCMAKPSTYNIYCDSHIHTFKTNKMGAEQKKLSETIEKSQNQEEMTTIVVE